MLLEEIENKVSETKMLPIKFHTKGNNVSMNNVINNMQMLLPFPLYDINLI